jgi:hypothetical protein
MRWPCATTSPQGSDKPEAEHQPNNANSEQCSCLNSEQCGIFDATAKPKAEHHPNFSQLYTVEA